MRTSPVGVEISLPLPTTKFNVDWDDCRSYQRLLFDTKTTEYDEGCTHSLLECHLDAILTSTRGKGAHGFDDITRVVGNRVISSLPSLIWRLNHGAILIPTLALFFSSSPGLSSTQRHRLQLFTTKKDRLFTSKSPLRFY